MSALRRRLTPILFISPWLVGFALLIVYPFVASLVWSFCRFDMLSPPEFAGLANYAQLADELTASHGFGQAVWNTAYYVLISVPISIAVGVGLAVMLSWNIRGQAVYRTLFFLPSVVPVAASAVLWTWLLDPTSGIVNEALSWFGLGRPGWFNSVAEAAWLPAWLGGTGGFGSKDALILMHVWGVGNFMIIYLAALGEVPASLYEAAELDGAGPWRRFRHVTLPMLSPVIFFNLVMGVIGGVQAFTQIYIVSEGQGAPAGSTMVLSLYLFLSAFKDLRMGYASAIAWVLFLVVLIGTALLFRTARHWVHYEGGAR